MMKHYESNQVILEKNMMDYFFKKRTSKNSIYKIFVGIEGNEDLDLEVEKFEKCTITFHFTDHDDMVGEIKRLLEYKPTGGRNIISYMKTMIKYLVEKRGMTDSGYFCVVV